MVDPRDGWGSTALFHFFVEVHSPVAVDYTSIYEYHLELMFEEERRGRGGTIVPSDSEKHLLTAKVVKKRDW